MGPVALGPLLAATALLITAALCPPVLRILQRRELLDVPNLRSSHDAPTPRGGGWAVAAGLLLAGTLVPGEVRPRAALLAAAGALALIGGAEDVSGLTVGRRLGLQAVVAAVAAPLVARGSGLTVPLAVLGGVLGVAWTVAFVNAFNFMDGINGISAVEAVVAGGTYAIAGGSGRPLLYGGGFIVAGAALGFLPFNFPKARMFLGDVGSYALGGWLAILAVITIRERLGWVTAAAPLAIYVADTGVTLIRRIARGEPWREAHRDHAYQRLVLAGWSHGRVSLFTGACVAACGVVGLACVSGGWAREVAGGLVVAVIAAGYLLVAEQA